MIEDFNISKFAVLSLKVSDIYVFVNFAETGPDKIIDNNVGTIKFGKTYVMWKNIDMETLLGDLYDKYEYFELQLSEIITTPYSQHNDPLSAANFGDNDTKVKNRNVSVYLKGLQWVNSSFNVKQGTNVDTILLCNIANQNGLLLGVEYPYNGFRNYEWIVERWGNWCNSGFLFKKQKRVNIEIFLGSMSEGLTYIPTADFPFQSSQFPHYIVKFNIIPIK